jgi:hypothetical protein
VPAVRPKKQLGTNCVFCEVRAESKPDGRILMDKIKLCFVHESGPGSSVGIATDYRLDGPGTESRREEIFRTLPDRP